jgi:hypothetical protein
MEDTACMKRFALPGLPGTIDEVPIRPRRSIKLAKTSLRDASRRVVTLDIKIRMDSWFQSKLQKGGLKKSPSNGSRREMK